MLSQTEYDAFDKQFNSLSGDDDMEKAFASFAQPVASTPPAVAPISTSGDVGRSFASGVARSIPQTLDFGGALAAKGMDFAMGGSTPLHTYLQMLPVNDAASMVLGPEYKPQTTLGGVAKFLGGFVGPGEVVGALPVAKSTIGVLKGFANATKAPRTAEELQDAYLAGREALKGINIPADQAQRGLVSPLLDDTLKYENPARYGNDTQNTIDELKGFGRKGVNANYLESFRQDLSQLPDKFSNPIRNQVDDFLDTIEVPTEFRTAYATKRQGENLGMALTKAGDSITKQRNAVNNFAAKQKGLSDDAKAALDDAGSAGIGEGLTRKTASLMGAGPSTLGAILTGNPAFIVPGVIGKLLQSGADARASSKIQNALKVVKAGGNPPSKSEQFGGFLRSLLQQ